MRQRFSGHARGPLPTTIEICRNEVQAVQATNPNIVRNRGQLDLMHFGQFPKNPERLHVFNSSMFLLMHEHAIDTAAFPTSAAVSLDFVINSFHEEIRGIF
jgi:hypothetical protein